MKNIKILIASEIDPSAITFLKQQFNVVSAFNGSIDTLKKSIKGCRILVFRSGVQITGEVMASSSELRLLIRAGSGTDNIDMHYLKNHPELKLIRIPGPGARAVAEMSFAFMLALSRNIVIADRLTKKGTWAKSKLKGHLLKEKILGIIGTGNIGSVVGQLGLQWGMRVIGCIEKDSHPENIILDDIGIESKSFNEVLSTSDYISIHVPLKSNTVNLIDMKCLDLMKPGAYLINLARGGVVNEQDLFTALTKANGLAGAALDVHEQEGENKISPLAELDNVILTPHIGAMTIDSQYEIGQEIIKHIEHFIKTK